MTEKELHEQGGTYPRIEAVRFVNLEEGTEKVQVTMEFTPAQWDRIMSYFIMSAINKALGEEEA
jgi:hypothetical protein